MLITEAVKIRRRNVADLPGEQVKVIIRGDIKFGIFNGKSNYCTRIQIKSEFSIIIADFFIIYFQVDKVRFEDAIPALNQRNFPFIKKG